MATTHVAQAIGAIDQLGELARRLGYEVVVQPGPMDAVAVVLWEIATVSVNSRCPVERQAEELVYIIALLVERLERRDSGLHLTFCQQAQVVDTVAAGICSELGLYSGRRTALDIAGVWDGADPSMLGEAEDLVARVGSRIAEHVISHRRRARASGWCWAADSEPVTLRATIPCPAGQSVYAVMPPSATVAHEWLAPPATVWLHAMTSYPPADAERGMAVTTTKTSSVQSRGRSRVIRASWRNPVLLSRLTA
jgi:hypothetical protein